MSVLCSRLLTPNASVFVFGEADVSVFRVFGESSRYEFSVLWFVISLVFVVVAVVFIFGETANIGFSVSWFVIAARLFRRSLRAPEDTKLAAPAEAATPVKKKHVQRPQKVRATGLIRLEEVGGRHDDARSLVLLRAAAYLC